MYRSTIPPALDGHHPLPVNGIIARFAIDLSPALLPDPLPEPLRNRPVILSLPAPP